MALSNTAIPFYYGCFREKVLSGIIPVCREIEQGMNNIDRLIESPKYYYDIDAIGGFVAYCENELTLTDGTDLVLLDSFKMWAEDLLSWFYFIEKKVYVPYKGRSGGRWIRKTIKKRLRNKQYLIVARGAAKSMYASCLQSYFLNVDTSTTHQITTAPTMRQADEVMAPIRTSIIRSKGALFKFLTMGSISNTNGNKFNRPKLLSTKKGIENNLTGSLLEVRAMTIDKLQGIRSKVVTIDEWLSGDIREDVVGAAEQGASKIDDYLIVAISSEGTVRNGPGDDVKIELSKILKGDYFAPNVSIWHYRLDTLKEIPNPDMWPKANPNIGITVSYEVYQRDVERIENSPSSRNDIIAKRFGIPMEGLTYFFTYQQTLPHPIKEYWGLPCSMGIDLSRGDDFCAFTFLFPLHDGRYGVKTRCYITSLTYDNLTPASKELYQKFISEDSLIIMEGAILDIEKEVYEDLNTFIFTEAKYDVRTVGYDPYGAKTFIEQWTKENGEYGVDKVIQGSRTESVPLGELRILAEERVLLFDQALFSYTMGNCIAIVDNNGNKKLFKKRNDLKIDAVSALLDGWVAMKRFPECFE